MHTHSYLFRIRAIDAVFTAAMILTLPLAAQVDVGLSPMKIELPAVAGKSYSGSLSLKNSGTTTARFRVEMVDFYVDENTTPQFVAHVPAEDDYSCRSWLSANPMELEVQPNSQVPIRYTVRAPASVTERSYHCAMGFRTVPQPGEVSGTTMRTAVRLMTVFYATVGRPSINGVIKELKLEQVADSSGHSWKAVVVMENSGLMLYRPVGDLEVLDATGAVVESQKVPSFPVLPKRLQRFVLPLKSSLSPGAYTLRARIEVGGEIQQGSVSVTAGDASTTPAPKE